VAVVGEAGVGKSRLVYEFTHSHRLQSWLVLESVSVSYGKATSYLPVIDGDDSHFLLRSGLAELLAAAEPAGTRDHPALMSALVDGSSDRHAEWLARGCC
jgi:hypothetical protein